MVSSWEDPRFLARLDSKLRVSEKVANQTRLNALLGIEPTLVSSRAAWTSKIKAKIATGLPRAKAVMAVNRENPGLREAMLSEINGDKS